MFSTLGNRIIERINRARYLRFAKSALRPEEYGDREKLRSEGYFSQNGQDKWVAEVMLPGRRGGVFVDIGAHDGLLISNTYFLEKEFGWSGLAVEPNPGVYGYLQKNRSCATVNACVGARDCTTVFRLVTGYAEQLSGILDFYQPAHVRRINTEIQQHGGSYQDIEVTCYSINTLLEKYKLYTIDYLSIDVEGGELSILSEINFDRFNVTVIGIENNYADYMIPKLLKKRGFFFHSIVGDEFYVNKNRLQIV